MKTFNPKSLFDKPRVLLFAGTGQDYLADDLLYGFRHLLGTKAVDWPRKDILYQDFQGQVHPRPEYAMNARYLVDDGIDRLDLDRRDFDVVLNLSCRRIQEFADCYIDGEDDMQVGDGLRPMFKRELPRGHAETGVWPITFGLPDHLTPIMPEQYSTNKTSVHSSFTIEHGRNRPALAERWPVEKYVTREAYIDAITRSKFVLSPKGAGWDCQRHYELLGRTVPVVEVGPDAPDHFRSMWRDRENCLTFEGDIGILEAKMDSVSPREWQAIVDCGYNELLDKYKASSVAGYVLKTLGVTY